VKNTGWKVKINHWVLKKYVIYFIANQIYMRTFNKQNGTHSKGCIPLKNLKKFFDMSKINKINPVLQRNGEKSSYALYYHRITKILISLS